MHDLDNTVIVKIIELDQYKFHGHNILTLV